MLRGYRLCESGLCPSRAKDIRRPRRLSRRSEADCAQLANTFQEDADYLAAWYSGWYNGLAKKHVMQVTRAKSLQHEVIVHCKANPAKKVIEAIDVVFKDYRTDQGIKMKK